MSRVRVGTGWQTIIADLSLILFMLTASVVTRQDLRVQPDPARPAKAVTTTAQPAPRSAPVAVWIAGADAPPLAEWFAQQTQDSRQQVTVTATYAPGEMDQAFAQARALAHQIGDARVVVEPGASDVRVVVGYDAPEARLARSLLE